MLSDFRIRLRAIFRRDAMERELDQELRFHIDRETDKLVAQGWAREAAAREAMIVFGGIARIKEDARDARGVGLLDALGQDLRYAWRGLRSRPGFTATVTIALAVGIGANATMFSIVDRLLFRAPPYLAETDRVHRVYLTKTEPTGTTTFRTMEYIRYADLTRWTTSFDRTGVIGYRSMAVGSGESTREMTIAALSASMFDFFAARPALGRFFASSEDMPPAGAPVAVLSHAFWQLRFGSRADVVGTKLRIGNVNYTIIGVAPPGFVGITSDRAPVAFLPVTSIAAQRTSNYYRAYGWSWLEMFAQRKPAVSIEAADADLSTAYRRSWEATRVQRPTIATVDKAKPHAGVGSLHLARGPEASQDSKIFTWVMGIAAIVLLIACANVANLLLARALDRRREVAVRLALGVSRARLMQQLMVESLLLASIGATVGLAIGHWGGVVMHPFAGIEGEARSAIADRRVVLFVAFTALGVAVLTGLAPILHAVRADINTGLKAGARSVSAHSSRARSGLLLLQGTLSVVLLVGAGLFTRSVMNLRGMRMGYDVAPLLYAEASLRGVRMTPAELDAMAWRMEQAAQRAPGVAGATLAASVPFWTNEEQGAPSVAGRDSLDKLGRFLVQAGSPSYFAVAGTRIVAGRGFLPTDQAGSAPVVVISERMASAIWPGESAIGKRFRIGSDSMPFLTVVGIAENMRARLIDRTDEIWYYRPYAQYGPADPQVLVRVEGDPTAQIESLRRRLLAVMPAGSSVNITPLAATVANQRRFWELGASMFVAFGGVALLLAAIGLHSVIAYAVAQRTRELGIRMALGATAVELLQMVVRQGVGFALAGVVIGSAIAAWAGRWIEPMLFDQSARDPRVFMAVGATLLLVAVIASARPALRATRVNPSEVLRSD